MRRTKVALSAIAFAAALGACGSPAGDSPANAGDSEPAEQSEQAAESGSYEDVSTLVDETQGTMGEQETVRFSMEMSGIPQAEEMAMDCAADLRSDSASCTGASDMVLTPEAVFMHSPEMAGMAGDPNKPWLKTDNAAGEMAGQDAADVGKFSDMEAMLPPGSTIQNSSPDDVDGQSATRYEIVTDLTEATDELPPEQQEMFQSAIEGGITELKQTLWIDEENLPIRAESTTPPAEMMGQQIPETTTTVNYSDWGEPVDVEEPPQEEVQEMPEQNMPMPN